MMKTEIRKEMLAVRDTILNKDRLDAQILEKLIDTQNYQSAKVIMCYISCNGEIDTRKLIEKMLSHGKSLCAPVCVDKGIMQARAFDSMEKLTKCAYGILEPVSGEVVSPLDIDLIVVPGVGFSENLHRIGYGGGYYDRFLKGRKAWAYGLFYEKQKVNFLPEETDVKLDYIITEKKIYSCEE